MSQRDEKGRFPKGVSGNPGGRRKGAVSLTTLLRGLLEEIDPETGKPYGQTLMDALVKQAAKGNVRAIELALERIDGPAQVQLDDDDEVKPRILIPGSGRSGSGCESRCPDDDGPGEGHAAA